MNWNQILESALYLIISSLIGTGIGTFIAQKLFEHRLNIKLSRFNKLYSDKLDVVRNLYRFLIKAEKALDILLSQPEPKDINEWNSFKHKTTDTMNAFIEYFEENEIFLEKSIVELIRQIEKRFDKAESVSFFANAMESDRGSVEWKNAIKDKCDLHEQLVKKEIPILKEKLKEEFQKKYQLLDN